MQVRTGVCLILFAIGLMSAVAQAQSRCGIRPEVSLPLYPNENGKFVVPVTIDGRELRLEPDLGAPNHTLISSVANALKLERTGDAGNKGTMFGGAPLKEYVTVKDVRIAGRKINGLQMFVLADNRLQGEDGTLASNFLIHFDIEFDYVAGRLNLFSPCAGRGAYWPHKDTPVVLPFKTNSDNHIILPARLDGKTVWARIDTGASASVFNTYAMGTTFGFTTSSPGVTHVDGAFDNRGWYRHTFDRLELGSITLPKAEVDFIPVSAHGSGFAELFIGSSILRNYRVYISYAERTVTLTEPTGEPERIAASNEFTQAYLAAFHGKETEAILLYSQAIASGHLAPSYRAAAHYERALLYAHQKQCTQAISDFASARTIDPYIASIAEGRDDAHYQLRSAQKICPGLTGVL